MASAVYSARYNNAKSRESEDREETEKGLKRGKRQTTGLPLSHWIWNPAKKQDTSGSVCNVLMNQLCVHLLFIRLMVHIRDSFQGKLVFHYILYSEWLCYLVFFYLPSFPEGEAGTVPVKWTLVNGV